MRALRAALATLGAACCFHAFAQDGDPLKSTACANALSQLQAARSSNTQGSQLETLRAAAASTCLGSASLPQRPPRVAQPPVAVPPPQIVVPERVAPLPAPTAPPPPVAIERHPTPLLCDAGGCWSNSGTHLRQIGPNLAGPNGLCTQQGGLVYCP